LAFENHPTWAAPGPKMSFIRRSVFGTAQRGDFLDHHIGDHLTNKPPKVSPKYF
jgi:hypothetical protein